MCTFCYENFKWHDKGIRTQCQQIFYSNCILHSKIDNHHAPIVAMLLMTTNVTMSWNEKKIPIVLNFKRIIFEFLQFYIFNRWYSLHINGGALGNLVEAKPGDVVRIVGGEYFKLDGYKTIFINVQGDIEVNSILCYFFYFLTYFKSRYVHFKSWVQWRTPTLQILSLAWLIITRTLRM